jgi:hypothetical protein
MNEVGAHLSIITESHSVRSIAIETFYEAADAARALEVTTDSIRLYARSGRLRVAATTPRGLRLFRPEDVKALREARAARRLRPNPRGATSWTARTLLS